MITIYDADRCPYCDRVRLALAEKGLEYEVVEVDLDDRPAWIYDKNPLGRVPVLEEGEYVLPESAFINEDLEERWPEPALWPAGLGWPLHPSRFPFASVAPANRLPHCRPVQATAGMTRTDPSPRPTRT